MKNLFDYIKESIMDDDDEEFDGKIARPRPQTKDELVDIIVDSLTKNIKDFNFIDLSDIDDISDLFVMVAKKLRNNKTDWTMEGIDISEWDTSNIKNMDGFMFRRKKFNCDISKWDVSKVENFNGAFFGCEEFDCDLSKWDVSNCKNFSDMFFRNSKLKFDISKWKIHKDALTNNIVRFTPMESDWDRLKRS